MTIDEDVAAALKEKAHHTRRPMKVIVNEALRAGLSTQRRPLARPYRLKSRSLGGVVPGVDLGKALRLADALEEEGVARKLELRK